MKDPTRVGFAAIALILICSFCAWAAPSFSYPTTYPNTVPMTDPGQLQMVNPPVLGMGGAQIAENNRNNAEAYKNAQEGNAAIIEAKANATLAVAKACEANPYAPGCAPRMTLGWDGTLVLILAVAVVGAGLFGLLHNTFRPA